MRERITIELDVANRQGIRLFVPAICSNRKWLVYPCRHGYASATRPGPGG